MILTMKFFWSEQKSGKLHYKRRYSFEVRILWESDIRWQVDILSANQKCRLLRLPFGRSFKNLKGELIAGGFSDCLFPSTPPPSFSVSTSVKLSRPVTLTLQITPKTRQLSRLYFTHYCTFQNTQTRRFKSQLTFAFTEKLFSVKHTPQNCFTHLQNLHVCRLNDVLSDPRSISCNKIWFCLFLPSFLRFHEPTIIGLAVNKRLRYQASPSCSIHGGMLLY